MVKSASTKLVREMRGGESYEYYPLGRYVVACTPISDLVWGRDGLEPLDSPPWDSRRASDIW